jgi:hypothetical protein
VTAVLFGASAICLCMGVLQPDCLLKVLWLRFQEGAGSLNNRNEFVRHLTWATSACYDGRGVSGVRLDTVQ